MEPSSPLVQQPLLKTTPLEKQSSDGSSEQQKATGSKKRNLVKVGFESYRGAANAIIEKETGKHSKQPRKQVAIGILLLLLFFVVIPILLVIGVVLNVIVMPIVAFIIPWYIIGVIAALIKAGRADKLEEDKLKVMKSWIYVIMDK